MLQCFVHNPLLRNYFLGDKHNWKQCRNENCMCCEMDKLFTEVCSATFFRQCLLLIINHQVFSDDNTPYGPYTFLATTWRASSELAGYAQQDAHEFFISALSQIHATSRGSTEVSCNCVIHSTFAGQLQSDVKCERCKNVTTTVDPILDISLELKGKGGEIASGENSLAACLRRQALLLPLISGFSRASLQIYSTGEAGIQRIQLRKMWEGYACRISYTHSGPDGC